jgi:hypothetical protein
MEVNIYAGFNYSIYMSFLVYLDKPFLFQDVARVVVVE